MRGYDTIVPFFHIMTCSVLTIECINKEYKPNNGLNSLFCGVKVTCDSTVKYIRAPYIADFNGLELRFRGWDKSEFIIDDYTVTGLTQLQIEKLIADCNCCGEKGTVTNFSAGNLSPLFTTNVATPTTTPALSFNLSNCNQYQVFGRVVAGTGAPSYVSLNPIAFNGLAIPNREVAFGNGTGITSTSNFQFTTGNSLKIGTGTVTGAYGINMGAGSNASNYVMNIGGGIVNNKGNNSLIICESGTEISGTGNANLSVLLGGNNNKIIAGADTYGNVIMGVRNTVTSTTGITIYNRILGNDNTITDAYYCNILGGSNSISSSGAYSAYYNDIIGYSNSISGTTSNAGYNKIIGVSNTISNGTYNNLIGRYCNNGGYSGVLLLGDGGSSTITATASDQFNSRFNGGYRFMKDGSTQWMGIAPTTGYVTINNIPTASSATDILVSNGGVVSTRTVASLGIPVITPAALTRTDDTNVTISLGGTPATALLQGVSLTMGWSGVLAISRGGTGLGSLGTAGQLLRTNSSATALEYFTPTFLTGNQTITLIGDITGSGATSIVTTIAANAVTTSKIANTAVTFAKFQNINTNRLLGRSSAGSGSVEEISIGTGLSLSGGTLSASGGGGNNVWLVQSSGIQATTNLEDIYHVGKVKVGSSGTSSFMLSVSGTTYSSQGMYVNNNYPYYGYNTSAVPIIIGKIDSSNMVSLGENNYNIILPAYTSSRSADSLATTDGYLYVTNAGVLNKHEVDLARNEGASVHITSTESHAADSTYRRVTFDTGSWSLYGGYTADYTTGDNNIILPSSVRYHLVIATIEYTTSGTPTVTVDIRKNSTAIETNISTSDDGRKVMTVHTLMYNASSSQYPTIYIKVSGAAITLQKCKLTAIPCGMAGS